jgi:hypothetical protein
MLPILGVYTICTEMYWSGAAIGLGVIIIVYPPLQNRILAVRLRGRIGCFVGAAGTASAGVAGRRRASATTNPPTATATSGFG